MSKKMWTAALLLASVMSHAALADPLVIELDPGHGGEESGAVCPFSGEWESRMNLVIAKALRDELLTYSDVEVYLTREDEEDLGLFQRVYQGVENGADVVISLHNNAYGSIVHYDHGATVLVQQGSFHEENGRISQELGCYVLSALSELGIEDQGLMLRYLDDTYPNGGRADYYGILRHAENVDLPAIIIEHGFIDHKEDYERSYADEASLLQLAKADAKGIASYYGLIRKEGETDSIRLKDLKETVTHVWTENADDNPVEEWTFFADEAQQAG